MALPNNEELAILDEFRGRVADVLTENEVADDMFLLRWLRARDLHLDQAEDMLRNCIQWRSENKIDSLIIGGVCAVRPFFSENFPLWLDGVDKENRPFLSVPFGKWDVRNVVREGKSDAFISYLNSRFEEANQLIKSRAIAHPPAPGHAPISQLTGVFDWDGFAWGQLFNYKAVQNLLTIARIYEAYFPEILHSLYFINCPSLISVVVQLIKPILAPRTLAKIKIFGTDKAVWQAEILKIIDEDQIRPQFGGTMEP